MAARLAIAGLMAMLTIAGIPAQADAGAAKEVFGTLTTPTDDAPVAIGGYARGCVAGAVRLGLDGAGYQAMRPSRNRHWGHPRLVAFVEALAADLKAAGHGGLLVGDMAQPRGGPMRTGHRSHQSGLDVDIWFKPAPSARLDMAARESLSALSLLQEGTRRLDHARFEAFDTLDVVKAAAGHADVARIFVHPAIKDGFCRAETGDRSWLRKVRPWWGHHYHFHVRLTCPPDSATCTNQDPPPPGDGCGDTLAWWFTDEPWQPSTSPPKPPLRMADLPLACARLVDGG